MNQLMQANVENPGEIITPRQARRQFLEAREGEYKRSTNRCYEYLTRHFVEFCEEFNIQTIGDVNNYVLESWKENRKKDDVKLVSVQNDAKRVRVFVRWCERVGMIERGTADLMDIPELSKNQAVDDTSLPLDRAERILRYLETFKYGTRKHAIFFTMWHTGCRASGAIALDVKDFEPDHPDGPILKFRDREALGTALKNGAGGERNVSISEDLKNVLNDYIQGQREGARDGYDRDPLFTTRAGRISRNQIYKDIVALTRPCAIGDECPHDRAIDSCSAAKYKKKSSGCPSSVSTHPIRRGSITYHLNRGWPKEKLSERVDVSVDVLEKHYDARTKEDAREGRKQFLDLL